MADENVENHENYWKQLESNFNNYEELKMLLFEQDSDGDNFIHFLIVYKEFEIFEFTLKKLEEILTESDFKEILKSKGQNERNLLHRTVVNSKKVQTHQTLWSKFHKFYNKKEEFLEIIGQIDSFGSGILNLAAAFTTDEIFKFIIEQLREIATHKRIRSFLIKLGCGSRNLLQTATKQNKSLELHKTLWDILRKYFNLPELLEFVIHDGDENPLKFAFQNSNEILNLTWKEVKQILKELCTDTVAVQNIEKCEKVIEKCLEFGPERCSEEEINVLHLEWIKSTNLFDNSTQKLLKSNFKIQNVLDLKPIARNQHVWCHDILWEHLKKQFDDKEEELVKLLLDKNENDNNFMHLLVILNSPDVIEFTGQKLKENIDELNYKKILKSKGNFQRNLLQIAAVSSKEVKVHQILSKFFQDYGNSDEDFLRILTETDETGSDVFHLAAAFATSEIFEFIFSQYKTHQKHRKKIIELLSSLGKKRKNLLQSVAIDNENLETHKIIWQIFSKYFNNEEITRLIEHCDIDGDNLLCCAVYCNTKEIVEFTWNQIKIFINTKEAQFKFLNKKGCDGKDLHQLALKNRKNDLRVALCVQRMILDL